MQIKGRLIPSFQSVKKVAERHFFEFYGFCLSHKT